MLSLIDFMISLMSSLPPLVNLLKFLLTNFLCLKFLRAD